MKVMHVITTLETGGAEAMLASLVLSKRPEAPVTHVVSLVPGGEIFDRLRSAGVPVTELGCTLGRPAVRPILRLARLMKTERPDVIQSWMYHADFTATLALLLSGQRRTTRFFWGVRCSDMDLRRYRWPLRLAVRLNAKLSRVPDGIIANSYAGRAYHDRLGYKPRRFDVIPNGIDLTVFHSDESARAAVRAELGIDAAAPLVALIARVDPMKDHACFLQALSHLPTVQALLVGKGTEGLAPRPGVHRLGVRSDVSKLLAAADLVVSSSAYGEGFPNSVAEGMACGVPAVVTDVGDAARIVGDTGLVVPRKDPVALASAMKTLLGEPVEQKGRRARRARERVEHHYSLAAAVEAFGAIHSHAS